MGKKIWRLYARMLIRAKKSMFDKFLPKDVEKDLFYEMSLLGCIKKQSK